MKIIAGRYGGCRLQTPQNRDIRPTSEKIRGAVFNMLTSRDALSGVRVLDAFCGSGALGLEALSRGASHCTFTDKDARSIELAKINSKTIKVLESCNFIRCNWVSPPREKGELAQAYNLIFLDPPYRKNLIPQVLSTMLSEGLLENGAWVVCESEKDASLPLPEGITSDHEKTYGDIRITLAQYQPITPV